MQSSAADKLIVALDVPTLEKAKKLVTDLEEVQWFKVGSQLFTTSGPKVVDMIKNAGKKVFLDLKYHDIPNTVVGSAIAATNMGVEMFDIHVLGGFEMMESATKIVGLAAAEKKIEKPIVLGVTILTSINEANLHDIFGSSDRTLIEEIIMLAQFAKDAGLDGVVASSDEVKPIKENLSEDFVVVSTAIRPTGWEQELDDQARVNTPATAIANGADYIVVGRPVLNAKNPRQAAYDLMSEIDQAMQSK